MFTKNELKQLETNGKLRAPVLSLYLNLDKKTPEGQHYLAELRRVLSIANKQIVTSHKEAGKLQKQLHELILPRLLDFIDEKVLPYGTIRAIAMFASLDEKQTRRNQDIVIYTLPRPVRSQSHVDNNPYVRPLLFLLDQYEQYAIVIANKNSAHFYLVAMGEIEQSAEFINDIPNRSKQGGWSQKRYEHRVDNAIEKHIQRVTKHLVKQIANTDVKRIVLGGDPDILYLFKKNLPDREQKMVIGHIPAKTNEPSTETLERTLKIAASAERASEKNAVLELRNALAHPNKATAGLQNTLKAINENRVQKLLLIQGFHSPGSWCTNCHTLSLPQIRCSNCQNVTKPVEDILEQAAEKVFLEDGVVEFVDENIDLTALGSVGALLRY
ncbi:MAG: Vms1/Ankzf1 family peptidyl-tRNA hydrolase [bacterium]|nr:Vms1/Ankzf1 family peptidyl-tRNA hydrolase [bacterium]